MAIWSQAQDVKTRQTIWVSRNVVRSDRPQLNSHTSECYQRDGIDGYEAWDIAGLYTDYVGNNWEAKHQKFIEKWGEVEVS